MRKAYKLGCELGLTLAISMLAATAAQAQSAPDETAVDNGDGIQDIVVTAQRKSESLSAQRSRSTLCRGSLWRRPG